MTAVIRTVALFSVLFATTCSIKCYTGVTDGFEKPSEKMDCAPYRSNFCVKARADGGGGVYEAIYACAVEDQCLGIGCMKAFRATKCCCNSDYCNTCSSIPLTAAIVPMMVVKLITF
ncbi:hypothetical protein ANCCAN_25973 [Ancylostoma caninum]|uniref:ET module n=1 Tax=Ancylostoma caninum TaxID=29170 RepID=A0A368F857_ANCCA|nr:hypothetical protein ANCCAN_25973 [Ancylostoma caninum]